MLVEEDSGDLIFDIMHMVPVQYILATLEHLCNEGLFVQAQYYAKSNNNPLTSPIFISDMECKIDYHNLRWVINNFLEHSKTDIMLTKIILDEKLFKTHYKKFIAKVFGADKIDSLQRGEGRISGSLENSVNGLKCILHNLAVAMNQNPNNQGSIRITFYNSIIRMGDYNYNVQLV